MLKTKHLLKKLEILIKKLKRLSLPEGESEINENKIYKNEDVIKIRISDFNIDVFINLNNLKKIKIKENTNIIRINFSEDKRLTNLEKNLYKGLDPIIK